MRERERERERESILHYIQASFEFWVLTIIYDTHGRGVEFVSW